MPDANTSNPQPDDDTNAEKWLGWILDAIRKIRSQKQRPSVERICHAIKLHHKDYHEDVVAEQLEMAVRRGSILKVFNKGQSSYKDPGRLRSRDLRITRNTDLSKVLARAVKELGERDGSALRTLEKFIRQSYKLVIDPPDLDLKSVMKVSLEKAVEKEFVEKKGKLYKSTGKPLTSSSSPGVGRKRRSKNGGEGDTSRTSDEFQVSFVFIIFTCLNFITLFIIIL